MHIRKPSSEGKFEHKLITQTSCAALMRFMQRLKTATIKFFLTQEIFTKTVLSAAG